MGGGQRKRTVMSRYMDTIVETDVKRRECRDVAVHPGGSSDFGACFVYRKNGGWVGKLRPELGEGPVF